MPSPAAPLPLSIAATQYPPLVMHSLRALRAMLLLAIGAITFFYLLTPPIRFNQIWDISSPSLDKTMAGIAGTASAVITMGQFNKLLQEVTKETQRYLANDPANQSLLRLIGPKTKIAILLLALSTLAGAYLLAMIQLRETQDIIDFDPRFENAIASVNAFSSELVQVIFGLGALGAIKELFKYISKEIAASAPSFNRQGRRGSGVSISAPIDPTFFSGAPSPAPYPRVSVALPVTFFGGLFQLILLGCYCDEYVRMLPEGVGPVLGYTLAALSLPGLICIFLLGMATMSKMLKEHSQFNLLNKFILIVSIVLSLAASFWEFIMGTESGREIFSLGIMLGSICMFARAFINLPFAYELLSEALVTLSNVFEAMGNVLTDSYALLANSIGTLKETINEIRPENWPMPGDAPEAQRLHYTSIPV